MTVDGISVSGYAGRGSHCGDYRNPKFVKVPGTAGRLALWGRPNNKQVRTVKDEGCSLMVTLQSERELEGGTLHRVCEEVPKKCLLCQRILDFMDIWF